MPSLYDVKPRFQGLLRPLLEPMVRAGLRPNHVTLAALTGSVAVGAALAVSPGDRQVLLVLPVWLLLRMALNALDGMLAREHGLGTQLGALLNEVGDVVSDAALYLPLALVVSAAAVPAIAFVLGAMLTEFVGVTAMALGASRRFDGPMGKSDRALLIGSLGLATALAPTLARLWPAIMLLAAALCVVTAFVRARRALVELATPRRGGETR